MSAPLPLASCDTPRAGQVWVHASGVTRMVLKAEGAWVRYRNALHENECTLKQWKAWASGARLVKGGAA